MLRKKFFVSILAISLSALTLVWMDKVSKCWAQPEIAISVLGDLIEIRGYYKTYQLSVTAVANMINKRNLEAIRSGSINHFAYDPIPWTPGVGRRIVESELALQWGVVEYLERIYRQKYPNKLKQIDSIKETLIKQTEFLEKTKLHGTRHMVDKSFYENLTSVNRKYIEMLLKPL
ncbi:MAG: hypothetical protein QMC83_09940 [Thermodesulfovibrionales bacterium]|nr:hypothetical protein [Thermodesulfovibrionales bacterium]